MIAVKPYPDEILGLEVFPSRSLDDAGKAR